MRLQSGYRPCMSVRYFYFCGHEQFGPAELLEHAIAAERHGFEGVACSDHLQPWWEPGESGHAWVWLGAAGRATSVPIGTGVGAPWPPVVLVGARRRNRARRPRVWKGAQPKELYRDDWHEPAKMYEYAEQRVSDDDLRQAIVISSDPEAHINGARELQRMGATIVVLANASGADPLGAIEIYGDQVLPALRGQRVQR